MINPARSKLLLMNPWRRGTRDWSNRKPCLEFELVGVIRPFALVIKLACEFNPRLEVASLMSLSSVKTAESRLCDTFATSYRVIVIPISIPWRDAQCDAEQLKPNTGLLVSGH